MLESIGVLQQSSRLAHQKSWCSKVKVQREESAWCGRLQRNSINPASTCACNLRLQYEPSTSTSSKRCPCQCPSAHLIAIADQSTLLPLPCLRTADFSTWFFPRLEKAAEPSCLLWVALDSTLVLPAACTHSHFCSSHPTKHTTLPHSTSTLVHLHLLLLSFLLFTTPCAISITGPVEVYHQPTLPVIRIHPGRAFFGDLRRLVLGFDTDIDTFCNWLALGTGTRQRNTQKPSHYDNLKQKIASPSARNISKFCTLHSQTGRSSRSRGHRSCSSKPSTCTFY